MKTLSEAVTMLICLMSLTVTGGLAHQHPIFPDPNPADHTNQNVNKAGSSPEIKFVSPSSQTMQRSLHRPLLIDLSFSQAYPSALERRRSLKSSSRTGSKSRSSYKKKSSKIRLGRTGGIALGSTLGIVVFCTALAIVFYVVWSLYKKEKDPDWRLRNYFKRNKGKSSGDDEELAKKESRPIEEPRKEVLDDTEVEAAFTSTPSK